MIRWAFLLFIPWPALAGAWTQHEGHTQIITTGMSSNANGSFDDKGRLTIPTAFNKTSAESFAEYGVTDWLTLLLAPTFVTANVTTPHVKPEHSHTFSYEAGGRFLLLDSIGILSVQASYKSAGAFAMSVSADHDAGEQIDIRLLYGTNYKLFGDDGFIDIQAGERFIGKPRPNETPVDLTIGLWVMPGTMVMLQNFNIVSGKAGAPYTSYRTHKLEFSIVQKLTEHWSLQSSAFLSPAGQNALDEQGMSIALWTQL